jgi:hypothetical protein
MTKPLKSRQIPCGIERGTNFSLSGILSQKIVFSVRRCVGVVGFLILMLCFHGRAFGLTFTGSQTILSLQNRTCYGGSSITFIANILNDTPSAVCGVDYFVNNQSKFELRAGPLPTSPLVGSLLSGYNVFCHLTGNGVGVGGIFDLSNTSTYPPGVYTLVGKILMIGGSNSAITLSSTFTVGYETAWSDLLNMTASPNPYSCKQSQVTANVAFGRALSSNYLSGNTTGWIETSAQFGTVTTSRSVYLLIGNTSNTTAFLPANAVTYLEYRKGGTVTTTSGEGLYIKNGTLTYKLQNVNLASRIRIDRTSGVLKFYNTTDLVNPLTAINLATPTVPAAALSIAYTNGIQISAYASILDDGLSNVISSFSCLPASTLYASLSDKLDGTNYKATDKLCFYYNEAYEVAAAAPLNYKIFNLTHTLVQGSTGANIVNVNRVYGDNRYELNVSSLAAPASYILEVTNDKKEVFYLRFSK